MALTRRKLLRAGGVTVTAAGAVAAAGAYAHLALSGRGRYAEWKPLRDALSGELVLPDDDSYRSARRAYLAHYDQTLPVAVAYCETARDVRECVRFAQDRDIPVAPRSGGHSILGWSTTTGLVIDMSRMNRVIARDRTTALIGPGAQAIDVIHSLAPLGLGAPTGYCPTVGTGGYLLGGGVGVTARKHGLGADQVTGAEVVLADGRIVRCSEDVEPDLFWALRGGGGGNFGIATEFEVRAFARTRLVNFSIHWPWSAAVDAFRAFQHWYVDAGDDLASLFTLLLPDSAAGNEPFVNLDGSWYGDIEDLEVLLDDLVGEVGHEPTLRTASDNRYLDSMMDWFSCAEQTEVSCRLVSHNPEGVIDRGTYAVARCQYLPEPAPASGVTAMIEAFEAHRHPGQFRILWVWGMGGEASRPGPSDTAWAQRDAQFLMSNFLQMHTPFPDDEDIAAAKRWADGAYAAADPYSTGGAYINFPDASLPDPARAYHGANLERLREVKRRYDPHGFFHFPQGVNS